MQRILLSLVAIVVKLTFLTLPDDRKDVAGAIIAVNVKSSNCAH